eukprot:TRINITY_DN13649_c0_g1_i1.p1 TRINITY_DN13649_c0_g1~~TRINITY_DN13649_c0_g1_i1.p1  ORF type:complete len:1044 (+),score=321.60 TRINITY_DN13649_c0_g1_i1:81-3134(+)
MDSLRPTVCRAVPLYGGQDCFVTLPPSLAEGLRAELQYKGPQVVVVEMTKDSTTHYATWNYNESPGGGKALGIPAILMRQLDFHEGDQIAVRVHMKGVKGREVHVVPVSVDDSEIVEHNAALLEEFILRQLRVAYKGLVCPIHVRKGVHVLMRVTEVAQNNNGGNSPKAPAPFVVLDDGTELIVETKMRKKPQADAADDAVPKPAAHILRIVQNGYADGGSSGEVKVYVAPSLFGKMNWTEGGVLPGVTGKDLVTLAWDKQRSKAAGEADGGDGGASLAAMRRHVFDVAVHPFHHALRDGVRLGAHEAITTGYLPLGTRLVIDPELESSGVHPELLSPPARGGKATTAYAEQAAGVHRDAWDDVTNRLKIFQKATEDQGLPPACRTARAYLDPVSGADAIMDGRLHATLVVGSSGVGKTHFLKGLKERVGMYVVEVNGGGDEEDSDGDEATSGADTKKTKSAKLLASFQRALAEAVANAPSVLLLDDLDKLAGAQPGDPSPHDPNLALRVSLFNACLAGFAQGGFLSGAAVAGRADLLRLAGGGVTVLATAPSVEALDAKTAALFNNIIKLALPGDTGRKRICRTVLGEHGLASAGGVLGKVARATNNYAPRDMALLCEKAMHHKRVKDASEGNAGTTITWEHMEAALDGFAPASVAGINMFQAAEGLGWSDVGGMEEAKKTFNETIILPAKYPELYRSLPVKLRSGILLYGPTGCGKSHIINCAVAEAGLNCIQVAGPELLNKYIGQSEQKVREVFEQAAAAAPCVLFFDEFDSIAPQRGHDNTGVTDRVVNQLLCHLDGAEERGKVYVVAATARPDLIDKALLRPGRLDVQLFCGMPTQGDREGVLGAAAKQLRLADDVSFLDIAKKTEGYTPADLSALLSTTRLKCVQQVVDTATALANMNIDNADGGGGDADATKSWTTVNAAPATDQAETLATYIDELGVVTDEGQGSGAPTMDTQVPLITQGMLLDSLKDSHPSISAMDAAKNEAIYTAFQTSRGGNEKAGKEGGQRVTLA